MITKFDVGEEVALKDISFVVQGISIGDKGYVRYKIGIRQHVIDSKGHTDDYCIGEFDVDESLLGRAVK